MLTARRGTNSFSQTALPRLSQPPVMESPMNRMSNALEWLRTSATRSPCRMRHSSLGRSGLAGSFVGHRTTGSLGTFEPAGRISISPKQYCELRSWRSALSNGMHLSGAPGSVRLNSRRRQPGERLAGMVRVNASWRTKSPAAQRLVGGRSTSFVLKSGGRPMPTRFKESW